MSKYDVVILTESRFVNPPTVNDYIQNILDEEKVLQKALEEHGLKVCRKDWADTKFDWSSTKSVLFSSTWDYFHKADAFRKWMIKLSATTTLINSVELIRWNLDKNYLHELKHKGVRIVPTRFIPRGSETTLDDLFEENNWEEAVLKPNVGAGGHLTYRLHKNDIAEKENKLRELIQKEDFMLQPFQKSITKKGEWSFVFFGTTFSHAVLKKAKPGDFRVQNDFGGTVHEYEPSQEEIDFAMAAVDACPAKPAYARVDVVVDNDGELALSELELIEPQLWFHRKPEAAVLLANEVLKKLQN